MMRPFAKTISFFAKPPTKWKPFLLFFFMLFQESCASALPDEAIKYIYESCKNTIAPIVSNYFDKDIIEPIIEKYLGKRASYISIGEVVFEKYSTKKQLTTSINLFAQAIPETHLLVKVEGLDTCAPHGSLEQEDCPFIQIQLGSQSVDLKSDVPYDDINIAKLIKNDNKNKYYPETPATESQTDHKSQGEVHLIDNTYKVDFNYQPYGKIIDPMRDVKYHKNVKDIEKKFGKEPSVVKVTYLILSPSFKVGLFKDKDIDNNVSKMKDANK